MTIQPTGTSDAAASSTRGSGQAYALFAVSLVLVVTIGSLVQMVSVTVGLAITEVVLILLPALLFVRWKRVPIARGLGWRTVPPAVGVLSVAVGVTGWGVAAGIHELTVPILGQPPVVAGLQPTTLPHLLVVLLCAAVLPGICEETLFRGAIQGILRRLGPARAVGITAFLFAVYHVNPWLFVPAFFLGVVFGTLVVRTGSTLPAMLAHVTGNATAFTVTYLYHDRSDSEAHTLMAILAVAFCVTLPAFLYITRGRDPGFPLLASVPARLSQPTAWIAGIGCGGVLAVVAALVAAVFLLVDVHVMSSSALAPEVRRGDRLIVLSSRLPDLDIHPNHIVALWREDRTVLRRVSRIDGDRVWISDESGEVEVPRSEIMGKVVHTLPARE